MVGYCSHIITQWSFNSFKRSRSFSCIHWSQHKKLVMFSQVRLSCYANTNDTAAYLSSSIWEYSGNYYMTTNSPKYVDSTKYHYTHQFTCSYHLPLISLTYLHYSFCWTLPIYTFRYIYIYLYVYIYMSPQSNQPLPTTTKYMYTACADYKYINY